jgi:tRNA threonylcarbamoyladenosine biosynthesis protein TsaE
LYHFDFYRFESPEEFLDAGFGEYFNAGAICLVEWPDRAAGCLPPPDIRLRLRHEDRGRALEVVAASPQGAQCLSGLNPASSVGSCCAVPALR